MPKKPAKYPLLVPVVGEIWESADPRYSVVQQRESRFKIEKIDGRFAVVQPLRTTPGGKPYPTRTIQLVRFRANATGYRKVQP